MHGPPFVGAPDDGVAAPSHLDSLILRAENAPRITDSPAYQSSDDLANSRAGLFTFTPRRPSPWGHRRPTNPPIVRTRTGIGRGVLPALGPPGQ